MEMMCISKQHGWSIILKLLPDQEYPCLIVYIDEV